ncbi:hypothetical protein AB0893_17485 [Micromonospora aurantiaca]
MDALYGVYIVAGRTQAAEVNERIRQAAETFYQALIEVELTAVIGAAPHQRCAPGGEAQRPPAQT